MFMQPQPSSHKWVQWNSVFCKCWRVNYTEVSSSRYCLQPASRRH